MTQYIDNDNSEARDKDATMEKGDCRKGYFSLLPTVAHETCGGT